MFAEVATRDIECLASAIQEGCGVVVPPASLGRPPKRWRLGSSACSDVPAGIEHGIQILNDDRSVKTRAVAERIASAIDSHAKDRGHPLSCKR